MFYVKVLIVEIGNILSTFMFLLLEHAQRGTAKNGLRLARRIPAKIVLLESETTVLYHTSFIPESTPSSFRREVWSRNLRKLSNLVLSPHMHTMAFQTGLGVESITLLALA